MRARVLALALAGLGAAHVAHAAPAAVTSNAALSATPVTINLGGGSFSFTADSAIGGADVATGGSGLVSSFFGAVSDFGAGSTIDGTGLYSFSAFPAPSAIPNSAADDFIGLAYTDAGATHYGYAEVAGAELVGYAYETTAGATILTAAATVAEPASVALLAAGLLGIGAIGRRARA